VKQQVNPENNDDVEKAFADTLQHHKSVNCIVYDRNCSFAPRKQKNQAFSKVKYWPIDIFHGGRHTGRCKYSPKNVPKYKRRLPGVNTQVCEQTFSWFRNYARSLNELRPLRQKFLILYYARAHNGLVAKGETFHAKPLSTRKQKRGHYDCAVPMKIMKTMKKKA
jgi:hypothetical protein